MKPLRELTLQDLGRVPVWRISGDSDATAYVEPSRLKSLAEDTTDVLNVRTKFDLRDGSTLIGYCSPKDTSGLDYTQPVVVCATGHARLPYEQPPKEPEPHALCRILGRTEGEAFPIIVCVEVPVNGQFYETVVTRTHLPDSER